MGEKVGLVLNVCLVVIGLVLLFLMGRVNRLLSRLKMILLLCGVILFDI